MNNKSKTIYSPESHSRLVNDPTVGGDSSNRERNFHNSKYSNISNSNQQHSFRRNNQYHFNKNSGPAPTQVLSRRARGWSKVGASAEMGNVFSSSNTDRNRHKSSGYQNQECISQAEQSNHQKDNDYPHHPHVLDQETEGYSTLARGRSSSGKRIVELLGSNVRDNPETITSSRESSEYPQREVQGNSEIKTSAVSPITAPADIRITKRNKAKDSWEECRLRKKSNSVAKERDGHRNFKTSELKDKRNARGKDHRPRTNEMSGRRHNNQDSRKSDKAVNPDQNFDQISDSNSEAEDEDLRASILRQKLLRQQQKLRNSNRERGEPGEIMSDGDDSIVTQAVNVINSEPGSTICNKRKCPQSPLAVKNTKASKTSHSDATVTVMNGSSAVPDQVQLRVSSLNSSLFSSSTECSQELSGSSAADVQKNLHDISSSFECIKKFGESQSPSDKSVDNSQEKQDDQFADNNHESSQPITAVINMRDQREIFALKQFSESTQQKLESEKTLSKNREEEIKGLHEQIRLSDQQYETKIKVLRGKKSQLENDLDASKSELSKVKKSLSILERQLVQAEEKLKDTAEVKKSLKHVERQLANAEEKLKDKTDVIQRLKRDHHDSQDKNKNDIQLMMALAYHDRLYLEVEKMKSVYEIEIIKLQDYYQSRVPSYSFQPLLAMTTAVGGQMVHNIGIGCAPVSQGTSAVDSVAPAPILNQRDNQGVTQSNSTVKNGNPHSLGIFDHLGALDTVQPITFNQFGMPARGSAPVPIYLNPAMRLHRGQGPMAPNQRFPNPNHYSNPNFMPVSTNVGRENH